MPALSFLDYNSFDQETLVSGKINEMAGRQGVIKGKSKSHNLHGQKAFGLIEVLVVVSIVGLLAALALPVFSGFVARSANSACLADVRAYASAVYATHYDEEAESTPSVASVLSTYPDDGACIEIVVNGEILEGTPRAPGDAAALQVVELGFAPEGG